jgi:chromosome segregation protein
LTKANSSIAILQQKLSQHEQMSQGIMPELQLKIDSLRLERDQLVLDLSASRDQLEDASLSLLSIEAENERLRQLLDENERSRKLDEGAATASQVNTRVLEDVKLQLAELNEQNTQLMAEQGELADRFLQAQNHLGNAAAELERALMEQNRLESVLREREQHATMMEEELNNAKVDRLGLQSQLQALEGSRGEASMNQKAMEDLAREYGTLRHELMQSRQKCSQQDEEMRLLKQGIANAELYHDENASLLSKVEELEGRLQGADQGRQSLGRMAAEYEQRMEEMSQQLNSISQERDQLLEERRMLEEENEEMLVQFGLLKEDMDATDAYVEQLEAGRSQLDQTAQNYLRELQETQQRLHDLTASLELESNEALLAADAAKEQLIREKGDLVTSVQELTRRNQKMEVTLKNIESEKETLMVRIADLQRQVSDVTQDRQTKESRLLAVIEDMEVKNQDLSDAAHFREKDIVELQSSLARSEEIGKDADDLRLKVSTLQQSLSDCQRLLLQKDSAIEDLRIQLDSAGKKPVKSSELETLRRTLLEMEESAERDRSHIQELEHLTDETTRELRKTRDRLSASENLVSQLRVDLEAKRHKEREIEDLQERLVTTERRLEQANQDTLAFRAESTDLRGSLTALEVELENHRRNLQQPAKEPSGQASAELQSLRQQIEMLKQQQIASSSQTGAREENIEREVFLLQQQMRQKDTEIGKLQSQLHSLDSDLSIKHKELESKQEYVDKLSSELQDLRTQSVATRALDLTRDDAENTEKMRQQIVSLAKALERSEGRRALVIERLEGERQANADSLRRLTESVKRFYGTLSMGES